MFATVPVYNSTDSTSETHIIQPAMIRDIAPHADVTVDSSPTSCVEVFFSETHSIIVLLNMSAMQIQLAALTGIVDEFGTLT